MKEMAYAALAIGFIGLMSMLGGVMYESDYRAFDCDNDEWLAKNGYSSSSSTTAAADIESCEKDEKEIYEKSIVYQDAGYPIILFAIVLMIGANKLKDK